MFKNSFINFLIFYFIILGSLLFYFNTSVKSEPMVKPDVFSYDQSYIYKNNELEIEFSLKRLSIVKAKLLKYNEYIHCNTYLSNDAFDFVKADKNSIQFVNRNTREIVIFTFLNEYLIEVSGLKSEGSMYFNNQDTFSYFDYKSYHTSLVGLEDFKYISWFAKMQNKYYLFAISGEDLQSKYIKNHIVFSGDVKHIYLGLKDINYLNSIKDKFIMIEKTVYYGALSFFIYYIIQFVDWLYIYLQNYGLVIIALTIILRIFSFFIMYKSHQSISKMNLIQDRINLIEQKFSQGSDDYNYALNKLYKKENINPFAKFWSQLFQMPIYYLFYGLIAYDLSFKNAPFLYLKDLSGPDSFILFDFSLFYIKFLPTLFCITILLQNRFFSASKISYYFLPLVFFFTIVLNNWPSGLLIYMILNNILGMIGELLLVLLI